MRYLHFITLLLCIAITWLGIDLGLSYMDEGHGLHPLIAFPMATMAAWFIVSQLWLHVNRYHMDCVRDEWLAAHPE